jgi:hypothetical protein
VKSAQARLNTTPPNDEMNLTRSALVTKPRPSQVISVLASDGIAR